MTSRGNAKGNLASIKAHQWKKGQSGNPGGRPKKPTTILSEAYREKLAEVAPGDVRTYAQVIASSMIIGALSGNAKIAAELRRATEGDKLEVSTDWRAILNRNGIDPAEMIEKLVDEFKNEIPAINQ